MPISKAALREIERHVEELLRRLIIPHEGEKVLIHEAHCDEYHVHTPPKCCSSRCPACAGPVPVVEKVEAKAAMISSGAVTCAVKTYIVQNTREHRMRVYEAEQLLMGVHGGVLFDFHCLCGEDAKRYISLTRLAEIREAKG
jgi:hypothetical protein